MSDPLAQRNIVKLDAAEAILQVVVCAHEVSRWWPEAVPELLIALDRLAAARRHLMVHVEIGAKKERVNGENARLRWRLK